MSAGFLELALFAFVLLTAVATAAFKDVLAAIIVFAAYSFGMAIFYAILLAPDVAMTEAAIGAGVTTLLLLLTIAKTVRPGRDRVFEEIHWSGVLVVGAFTTAILVTVTAFPEIGAEGAPIPSNPGVSQYYIDQAYHDTGVENVVTAVLAGYRGFDTFGEAVVVFAAGISVLVVLHSEVFTRE